MILHTLSASPTSSAFADCLRVLAAGDAIILMGDGVYAAQDGSTALFALQAAGAAIHVLESHAQATGVTASTVNCIDMDGFVALTESFPRQQAWY